jgi:RimJ/RimL family protein N-acetyltransferase
MSSEDYLIRYFRQLGKVLATILEYRKRKEYSLAIEEINQTLSSWFDIDIDKNELDEEWIAGMLSNTSPGFESEKSLAELLYQKADTYQQLGNSTEAARIATLALFLYREIDSLSGEYSVENQIKIAELERLARG